MTKTFGLSGSLRAGSLNAGLLRAAAELAPDGQTCSSARSGRAALRRRCGGSGRIPAEVRRLKDQLAAADALLLVTPEYNNGVPGVFKNAIDWMTRPSSDIPKLFGGKPIAVLGASPGGFGTIMAQNHWLPVLRTLGTRPWFEGRMLVSRAGSLFDDKGNLADAATRDGLRKFMTGFAGFVTGDGR